MTGAGIAACLVMVLVSLLWAPLQLRVHVERLDAERTATWRIALHWLFGAARLCWQNHGPNARKPKQVSVRAHVARKRWALGPWLRPQVQKRLLAAVQRVLLRVRIDRCRIHGILGTEDPAATGMLWGLAFPLLSALTTLPAADLNLRPDFTTAGCVGELDVSVHTTPAQLLYASWVAIGSRTCWAAMFESRRGRGEKHDEPVRGASVAAGE